MGLFYCLNILCLGLPILLDTPQEEVLTYVVATVVPSFIVFAVVGEIVGEVSVTLLLHSMYPFY